MLALLYNEDNIEVMGRLARNESFPGVQLAYCDMLYEDHSFDWLYFVTALMDSDRSILIVQTDWHTVSEIDVYIKKALPVVFLNHLVWKNEWGNHPKNRFHQCYDDILIYYMGNYSFHSERIQVPKATSKTKLNPSGRDTKQATAWIEDICLTTTSNERVKKADGHNIKWQKPLALYDRVIWPFLEDGDIVLDPFMGSGSLGKWCNQKGYKYIGIEKDSDVFKLAEANIYGNEQDLCS